MMPDRTRVVIAVLVGIGIGLLPLAVGYSAGRGWINPGWCILWPGLVGTFALIGRFLLAKRTEKTGSGSWPRRSYWAALGMSVGIAWLGFMPAFMEGFREAVESRVQPQEFAVWAENRCRSNASETNSAANANSLPNGLESLFSSRHRIWIGSTGRRVEDVARLRGIWGGGHWSWVLGYSPDLTNEGRNFGGRELELGHGVWLMSR
jgi:hypothetical protein